MIDDWKQLNELFGAAILMEKEDALEFLKESCGEDKEVHSALVKMVNAHFDPDAFPESPILEDSVIKSDEPETIGNYTSLRLIGEGGMGSVYLAKRNDDEFEHFVALKIVHGRFANKSLLDRFRQERQILASLSHPNIASLLDGGTTDDGLPYFAMEYVEGRPLIEYCEAMGLSLEEKIRLFLSVCDAAADAHKNLVLHRDIKPSNVLVNDNGVVKLLDFGIAKPLDEYAQESGTKTETGMRPFTPDYASPEQISGKRLNTSSDIYSLGVVLYELLTGTVPFDRSEKDISKKYQRIIEETPIAPSERLNRKIGEITDEQKNARITASSETHVSDNDLDTIVLKALRKSPENRYASVDDLREDLENFLDGKPIKARKPSLTYNFKKLVLRNRIASGAIAAIVLTVFGALGISLWQTSVANAERAKAESRFKEVRSLANSIIFDYHDEIKALPGSTKVREKMLKDTITYLDRLAVDETADSDLRVELAKAYVQVGNIQGYSGDANKTNFGSAEESFKKALQILDDTKKESPSLDMRLEMGTVYKRLGAVYRIMGDLPKSTSAFRSGLETFNGILDSDPKHADARFGKAASMINISTQKQKGKEIENSIKQCQEGIDILEGLVKEHPKKKIYESQLTSAYEALGDILVNKPGRESEARELFGKAQVRFKDALEKKPDSPEIISRVALSYLYIAQADFRLKEASKADAGYRKALSLYDEAISKDKENTSASLEKLYVLGYYAHFLAAQDDHKTILDMMSGPRSELEARVASNPKEKVTLLMSGIVDYALGKAHLVGNEENSRKGAAPKLLKSAKKSFEKIGDEVIAPEFDAPNLLEKTKKLIEAI